MSNTQSRRWVFTLFFQDGTSTERMVEILNGIEIGSFGCAQLETAPGTGRFHIQGFVLFSTNKRFNAVKTMLRELSPEMQPPHVETMSGNVEDNERYCSKDESRVPGTEPRMWGERPEGQGKRNDLHRAAEILKSTVGDERKRMRAVADEVPSVVLKYPRGLQMLASLYEPAPSSTGLPSVEQLYDWQANVLSKLALQPDNRKIIWVADPDGCNGKSTLVNICLRRDYVDQCILLDGRVADMAYAYNGQRIVFFDITRTQADNLDHLYSFAEKLKNGVLFSSKFDSKPKIFDPPHVVFLSNSLPDMSKWTHDRYDIVNVSNNFNFPL